MVNSHRKKPKWPINIENIFNIICNQRKANQKREKPFHSYQTDND